jgi:hypothetical protein
MTDAYEELQLGEEGGRFLADLKAGRELGTDRIRKHLVTFLNRWRSRFPYGMAESLAPALKRAAVSLRAIPDTIELHELEMCHAETIREAFTNLCAVHRVHGTIASKILSLFRPHLCVMWDDAIAKHYGVHQGPEGYVLFSFLMRDVAMSLLAVWGGSSKTLCEWLCAGKRTWVPPLAKLIDEYNWITITRGMSF